MHNPIVAQDRCAFDVQSFNNSKMTIRCLAYGNMKGTFKILLSFSCPHNFGALLLNQTTYLDVQQFNNIKICYYLITPRKFKVRYTVQILTRKNINIKNNSLQHNNIMIEFFNIIQQSSKNKTKQNKMFQMTQTI